MKFLPTKIPEVILIEPTVFGDDRGFFMETRHQEKFITAGINYNFVQDNASRSAQGVLRGLHYQIQHPQGKLVRVIAGKVFDVAVDMRKTSPTFGQWVGEILSAENRAMLWVPPGFAHGFYVLSESADFIYSCTDFYKPEFERTLLWNDPDIAVQWPQDKTPVVSAKDAAGYSWQNAEYFS